MSWLIPSLPSWASSSTPKPSSSSHEPRTAEKDGSGTNGDANEHNQDSHDEIDGEEEDEEDLDAPPQFPLPNSAQRSQAPSSSNSQSTNRTTSSLAAPPPPPPPPPSGGPPVPPPSFSLEIDEPDSDPSPSEPPTPKASQKTLPQPTNPAPSLPPPPTTTVKPNPQLKKRQKFALAPGCSPLDWARFKASGSGELRGGEAEGLMREGGVPFLRITLEELKKHNKSPNAWSAFNGKVYNISAYARFHPGGEKELMRVAGRDGTKLFMLTHAWVNVDYMMDTCLIGMLVPG